MSQLTTCPTCQAKYEVDHSTGGMCPKCLLRGARPAGPAGQQNPGGPINATRTYENSAPKFPVMKPAEVNKLFPELDVLDVIGHGGMGIVYKATQKNLGREVALKLISSELMDSPAFAERFSREARAMAMMNHPNIISIYDFGQRGRHHFLVMEYVDGLNLRQLVQNTKLEPAEAMQMVPQLCDALQYAHDRGIVHRDIKPENVLISQDGLVKIADFGLAKLTDGSPGDFTLTQSRQVMGTLNYMAPEQVEHPTDVDHRADIYSLGVVIYELLTGELPLGRFSAPSAKVKIDVRLDEVVLRALEKDPSLRYQQASEFKTGLQNASSAGPFVRKFGGTTKDQVLASKIGKFVWQAIAMTLAIAGGVTLVVVSVMDKDHLQFVGFVVGGLGALMFALYYLFQSVFFPEEALKIEQAEKEKQHGKPPASPFATLLWWIAIAIIGGSIAASYFLSIDDMVVFGCIIGGLLVLAFRTLFVPGLSAATPANLQLSNQRMQEKVAKETVPLPNWLLGVKIVALCFFFACPLFWIAYAFSTNSDNTDLFRFLGIASPIVGAFISAIVKTIARNKGFHDPDDDKS